MNGDGCVPSPTDYNPIRVPENLLIFLERKNDGNPNEQSEFIVASPF